MKKISTLALALIAMGSLALPVSAQETFTPVSSIDASGWYQMRQVVGVNNTAVTSDAPVYVYSLGTAHSYTWFGTASTQKEDATAFVYVDKGTSNYAIQNINGKYGTDKAGKSDSRSGFAIQVKSADDKTFTVGSYWDDWASFNGYMGGSGSNAKAEFQFSKVSDTELAKYDIYTVTINGTNNATATSTIEANKGTDIVYSGGHFFFTTGTSLTESDITSPDIAGSTKTTTIDASTKTITITYTLNESAMSELIDNAKSTLAKKGIGCPKETAASRTTLNKVITTAEGSKTVDNYTALSSALNTYATSTADIEMPEDGKTYTFTALFYDGTKAYMDYAESGYKLTTTTEENNANYPVTAKLICRKISDGKYTFTNNAGKHFIWKGSNGANSNLGYVDTYNADYAVTITKITSGNYVVGKTNADLVGYVGIKGYRILDATKGTTEQDYFVFKVNPSVTPHTYGYDQANVPFYKEVSTTSQCSSLIKIEETTYPNTVTFNDATGIEGVNKIATFSAPFATIKPEGVKAYYVGSTNDNKATMTEISGNIPANTGVILTSESGDAVTMVPVADEEVATVENNKLGHTAGADKTITDETALVLGLSDGTVAFYKAKANTTLSMNKAYLTNGAAGSALKLDFGTATGINNAAIADAAAENAPVFDLTGRRVAKTVKGNLYIKGGKKYIAQ